LISKIIKILKIKKHKNKGLIKKNEGKLCIKYKQVF